MMEMSAGRPEALLRRSRIFLTEKTKTGKVTRRIKRKNILFFTVKSITKIV